MTESDKLAQAIYDVALREFPAQGRKVRKYGSGAHLSADERRLLQEIGFSETGIRNNIELFMQCKSRLDFIYELALIVGRSSTKSSPCGWCIKTLKGKLEDLNDEGL